MTELKCPFCQQELKISGHELHDLDLYCDKCEPFMVGNKELWQALIDTKEERDTFEQHYKCLSHVFKHQIEVNDFLTDEANKLQKKLDIAVDALKDITFCKQFDSTTDVRKYADNALEQINNVEGG